MGDRVALKPDVVLSTGKVLSRAPKVASAHVIRCDVFSVVEAKSQNRTDIVRVGFGGSKP